MFGAQSIAKVQEIAGIAAEKTVGTRCQLRTVILVNGDSSPHTAASPPGVIVAWTMRLPKLSLSNREKSKKCGKLFSRFRS